MTRQERIRITFNYIIILLFFLALFILFSPMVENKFITIIVVYILIGALRTKFLVLQPPGNQPIAVIKRQWGYLLLFGMILWLPFLILSIFNNGIRITYKGEVYMIKNVLNKK